MKLKPWYKVVTPREDLREGKPMDAAQFAVHLDRVQDGTATKEYTNPEEFFSRTFLTQNLLDLSTQVVRRLNGVTTETSSVFNLATQFGGGKTHSLTLLYHLAKHGYKGMKWAGVSRIMENAGVTDLPEANIAVFVGTEFDSITGRGGDDGIPLRTTPWGEIAYQIGLNEGFEIVAEHDKKKEAPAGDTIRKLIDPNKPTLILLDELMSWIGRNIKSGMASQFYNFLQSLTSTVTGMENVVLVVSVPASEMEMSADEHQEYDRITKWLNREGKAIVMNAENEASEIIRRRLFEWNPDAITGDGRVLLDKDAHATCGEYASWILDNESQIPKWFSDEQARKEFESTYPFHPSVISVFQRKWRGIPKFQQTRGVLRLLALWVSKAYEQGFKGGHKDHLIGLGTAPLEDSIFRSACFEELNERNLEVAVVTDIAGQSNSHSIRLDAESTDEIKKARLHQKVATSIFFESNGGQIKGKEATVPEVRLAVGDPSMDIGNVETTLDALIEACYYLQVERNQYAFGLKENLNKRYTDHRATVNEKAVDEHVAKEIRRLFVINEKCSVVYFPEKSIQISDHPALTFAVADIGRTFEEKKDTMAFLDKMTKESGSSNRKFKSGIVWCVADSARTLRDEAAKMLAWQDIENMGMSLNLDDAQKKQLSTNINRAKASLSESVWRAYKHLVLLGKDNDLREIDLGLITSSAASSPLEFAMRRLIGDDVVTKSVVPRIFIRNWPPAFKEWSTKSVRDAFFAAPQLPKLLNPDSLRETIARGVSRGEIGYVGKTADGKYKPFYYNAPLDASDVELSDDMYIITEETGKAYADAAVKTSTETQPEPAKEGSENQASETTCPTATTQGDFIETTGSVADGDEGSTEALLVNWSGEIPPSKWMTFYTKVVTKYATDEGLSLNVNLRVTSKDGISQQKIAETNSALRDLGLDGNVEIGSDAKN